MEYIHKLETMDGNTAAAMASYNFTEVAAIYPITPSSTMAEAVDKWSSQGRKNVFGHPVRVMEMQSEGGAAGTLHGCLQSGALASTYTSSQGLLLMIPNLYKIAGELLPGVLHVSARSLASNALSIFGDHQDVMSIRQTGVVLLASANVQECMDLGSIAHLATVSARLPFVHFFDGFRTSHEIQKIEVIDPEALKALYDWEALKKFRDRALNPDHPVLRGTTQNPDIFFQEREAVNKFYDRIPQIVQNYMDKLAGITGRQYRLFDYYGAEDAEIVLVAMGSSCDVIKETLDYLNMQGKKYGLLQVRLYRPFSAEHFLEAIPASAKKIVVLDRTKEPGANGEPLYQDVCTAFYGQDRKPLIIGGRYGLASKEFAPKEVVAVLKNAESDQPRSGFTVGIVDDVTNLSLPVTEVAETTPEGTVNCKFWGLGSDGTVSANKSAIKIIGNYTPKYVQGYFSYDSKKSGGLTVSHLRFGDKPIKSSYLVDHADYIACHNQSYVGKYDLLEGIKENGIFLLNCPWEDGELKEKLPAKLRSEILEKKVRFYTIDASRAARAAGMGKRINMVMQSAFFCLGQMIPYEDAKKHLKEEVVKNYGHQGERVVEANYRAIDEAASYIHEVCTADLTAEYVAADGKTQEACGDQEFLDKIMNPMNGQQGDKIPVSAFNGVEDGTFPTNTTQYEKRNIALEIPKWDAEKCIQCNRCSLVCPHSVLRPKLLSQEQLNRLPESVRNNAAKAKGYEDMYFYMALSPMDCTGCNNCIQVCPAKEKALVSVPNDDMQTEAADWELLKDISNYQKIRKGITIKDSQFLDTYFEFSGACAGCGETPYARLITQLFGDRMMISNSAGCATVWGGSAPAVPYKKDVNGHGPAWGFSLFEDNAEYGMGMCLGYQAVREEVRQQLIRISGQLTENDPLKNAIEEWEEHYMDGEGTRERADRLTGLFLENAAIPGAEEVLERKDYFVKRSNWIFGGDGWAYDIGYGGLDHVLSTGIDINVMVFDTEVYSNTGGQSSKSTPKAAIAKFAVSGKRRGKKELGMMAMQYGEVYVAQIALGADPAQALRSIQEAESYPGPSLIIGYAPCINHGIKGGMGQTQLQQKRAVEAGYWNLYHFDPRRKEQNLNPFVLDSKAPRADYRDFLMSEVRFSSLMKKNPQLAEELFRQAESDALKRYERYKKLGDQI